jgi:hypothetical protein
MRVVIDESDTMVRLGEVAVWSFDLAAWGECTQAPTEREACAQFGRRVGVPVDDLEVGERITGPSAVFAQDLLPAVDEQIFRTTEILDAQRALTLDLLNAAGDRELDATDPAIVQPAWMSWRTPRTILRHIADTESRAYPRWCGLPQLEPIPDLRVELDRSADHVRQLITSMPRAFQTEHRGETWTPVKLLRRLAWHERIELIFLRRRLAIASGEQA